MKLMIKKFNLNASISILILLSVITLIYKILNQQIINIDEFKYVDWSTNIFNEKAVLNYYRPFYYILNNLFIKIFGLSLLSFKLVNLICFVVNIFIILRICNLYFENKNFSIIPLIFFLFNPHILNQYSIISPFPISQFFILTNLFLIFLIIQKKK